MAFLAGGRDHRTRGGAQPAGVGAAGHPVDHHKIALSDGMADVEMQVWESIDETLDIGLQPGLRLHRPGRSGAFLLVI